MPDHVLGLRELARVVRPGGQVLLLEHMRLVNALISAVMDALNPIVVRMMGANINRRTVENVQEAKLEIESNAGILKQAIWRFYELDRL